MVWGDTLREIWPGNTTPALPSGRLDLGFSGDGVQIFDSATTNSNSDGGSGVREDTNGNILIAGYVTNADGNSDAALMRYLPDGSIDTTFGYDYNNDGTNDGYAKFDSGTGVNRFDYAYDLAITSNNQIVVVGYSDHGASTYNIGDLLLLRYNANGTLDTTFGSGGIVFHNNAAGGNGGDYGKSVAIDDNDRIVIAGYSAGPLGHYDLVVWRYLANGTLDTTFGGDYDAVAGRDGYVVHTNAAGGGGAMGASVAIDSLGRIVVAGEAQGIDVLPTVFNQDMAVWRFTSSGDLDATFSGNGYFVHDGATMTYSLERANAVKVSSTGSIIIVGTAYSTDNNYAMVIWSMTNDGVLDTSFGGDYDSSGTPDGYVVFDQADLQEGASFDFDSAGNIVVAGRYRTKDLTTWRYTSNGQLDTTYGDGGIKRYGYDPVAGTARQMLIDSNGKIVITGYIYSGSVPGNDVALWRIIP